ncbi:MAG: DUF4037 domain-containing protein [Firmicutes bacterium]|nr:DUF4037 domain-containing protein [Bacillota bacterium]
MNGLELARGYYNDCARELILNKFPDQSGRIAAGLVGEGSECFGFDDEISKDHDFCPRFFLWLSEEDEKAIGDDLRELYDSLPSSYEGVPRVDTPQTKLRSGVWQIGSFYDYILRSKGLPETRSEWLRIPDQCLAAATNGEVFTDPLGEFTRIREYLSDCPEDVWLTKLSGRLFEMAQSGQYNYPRTVRRGDTVAQHLAMDRFISSALMTILALNRRYSPFYKWLFRAAKECTILRETVDKIRFLTVSEGDEAINRIEAICGDITGELARQGLTSSHDTFLVAHSDEIAEKLRDR